MTSIELSPTLIVEDDPATRRRLHALLVGLLGTEAVIAMADSVASAIAATREGRFALALVDVGLPDGNGVDVIAWLHVHAPDTVSVVISSWGHEDTVLAALRSGATGYLLKESEDIELGLSLKSLRRGGAPIDPVIARRILAQVTTPAPVVETVTAPTPQLSERELEVLHLVARGYSNPEIATMTGLSRFTIEDHTKKIYRKLAVNSRMAAVFEANSLGLLK
ncbi:response regulator [Dyella choica]|uniref:Response regulator transcription factor n=1 Tax=Dyella choica TaxID=1927959 RepID=A0A3S0PIE8_9GAMM|nr:response regulator transcription factor [Dyella choica]RUL75290.1 response regulator transcription factor [Dyella choica]